MSDFDDVDLMEDDEDTGDAPPNWEMWTSMRGAEKLDDFLGQFPWETQHYFCLLSRSSPAELPVVGKVAGHVEKLNGPMKLEWLAERHGGGVFKVQVNGPHPGKRNRVQYLKACSDVIISGRPRIPMGLYNLKYTLEFDADGTVYADGKPLKQVEAEGAEGGQPAQSPTEALAAKVIEHALEENKELRRKSMDDSRGRPSDMETFMRFNKDIADANMKTAEAAQQRFDKFLEAAFTSSREKGMDPEVLNALQREAEKERRALMEEINRSRDVAREREADLRRDATEARESMRRDFDRQLELARQSRSEALEQMRSEHTARVNTLQDAWTARERDLKDTIDELRNQLRSHESKLSSAVRERDDTKLQLVLAQAQAGKPVEDPMEGVRKMFGFTQEIMQLTGQAPKEPTLIDQAKEILGTEPARRVAGGVANLISNLGNRGGAASSGGGGSSPQSGTPDQSALDAWEKARGGGGGTSPKRRRTHRARQQLMPAMPGGNDAPEGQPEQKPEVEVEVSQEDAVSGVVAIEEAARKDQPLDDFNAGFEMSVGGPAAMAFLVQQPPDLLIGNLEAQAGMELSIVAKAYLRKALEAARKKYNGGNSEQA